MCVCVYIHVYICTCMCAAYIHAAYSSVLLINAVAVLPCAVCDHVFKDIMVHRTTMYTLPMYDDYNIHNLT